MLIIMAGLPGAGKTTVARELAKRLNGIVLSKDTVRHALFPPELVEYSERQDDFVIDILLRTAQYLWNVNSQLTVILDGRTFSRRSQRKHVIDFAEKSDQSWRIIECTCNDEVAKQRLSKPDPDHPAANRTPALYDEMEAKWEPIEQDPIVIKTDDESWRQRIADFEKL